MHDTALQPVTPDTDRVRLAALERDVLEREREIARVKRELQALQSRYLEEIGVLYGKLYDLEGALADAEIAVGLRPPLETFDENATDDNSGAGAEEADAMPGCGHRGAPSSDLKRIFRQLARTIHPDLARDGAARYRRHSLMAEANRAYAERDEDRLRLILSRWELGEVHDRDDEPVAIDDDPEAERRRVTRRIARLEERRLLLEAEMADLRTSAIWRLNARIDEARKQGWDLFAEMIREVQRDIRRTTERLAKLKHARPFP